MANDTQSNSFCACDEDSRSACQGEQFYGIHNGKQYCVLHYPNDKKIEPFRAALKRKMEAKDFNFREVWFPEAVDFEKHTFTADANFHQATFNASANFSNSKFSKVADFDGATFNTIAKFDNVSFGAYVYFLNATFSKSVSFREAKFNADAKFHGVKVEGDADFYSVNFGMEAKFSGAKFGSEVIFASSNFSLDSKFEEATFSAETDFSETKFNASANFRASIFNGETIFDNAEFNADAIFFGTKFSAHTKFYRTKFRSIAKFNQVAFIAEANFLRATFGASANFSNATFNTRAGFDSTAFGAEAHFGGATFGSNASFVIATFTGDIGFDRATFSADTSFDGAQFSANASFERAIFNESASFDSVQFNGGVTFNNATFKSYVYFAGHIIKRNLGLNPQINFQFAHFEKPERVSFHTLNLYPHWFVNVDSRKFEFTDVEFKYVLENELKSLEGPKMWGSSHRLLVIACRQLADNAEANHRYNEASRLRYSAFEARRIERLHELLIWKWKWWSRLASQVWEKVKSTSTDFNLRKKDWWRNQAIRIKKWCAGFPRLDWWYWLASGYGESVGRASLIFTLLIGLFAFGYKTAEFEPLSKPAIARPEMAATGQPPDSSEIKPRRLGWREAALYSFNVSILQKPEPKPRGLWGGLLVSLETVLGPAQAALLALAVRRRFMR